MFANVFSLLVTLALAALFGWLAFRAWRSRRSAVRWAGSILSGSLALALALIFTAAGMGFYRLSRPAGNPAPDIKVAGTAQQLERGARLANLCADCHSTTGQPPLDGSRGNLADLPGGPSLGVEYAPNLTPAADIKEWPDGELIRAIREGVDDEGRALVVHPAQVFRYLSDDDVQALVAYLRSQPAVENPANAAAPENGVNLLGALLVGSGIVAPSAQPPISQPVLAPPAGATAEYGKYLVTVGGCGDCHGEKLAGGSGGLVPAGPGLIEITQKLNRSEFVEYVRLEGKKAGEPNPQSMPWKSFSNFAGDDDLAAIYAYLQSLASTQRVTR